MKRVWSISFRHGRGKVYACDLNAHGKRVASVPVPPYLDANVAAPEAFRLMVALQPAVADGGSK